MATLFIPHSLLMCSPFSEVHVAAGDELEFHTAKQNLKRSIHEYRSLKDTFLPNDDTRDAALLEGILKATTWTQMGVLASNLSPRFALLQKPLRALGSSYTSSVSPRFYQGTVGWYWTYGSNSDVNSAYLLCIFRYPTAKDSTASQTMYCVFGYVVREGVTVPFSHLGVPLFCPGVFAVTKSPDTLSLVMDLRSYATDPQVALRALALTGTGSGLAPVTVRIEMKSDGYGPAKETGCTNYTATLSSALGAASFEGTNGCAPCADGAGFNYWSFTYLAGGTEGGFVPPVPRDALVGWFDHQWFDPVPKGSVERALTTVDELISAPVSMSWIFLTLQPSVDTQYMVFRVFSPADLKRLAVGKTYKTKCTIFKQGRHPRYGVDATIRIRGVTTHDGTVLPDDLLVRVRERAVVMVIKAACDGRVTMPNGSINLEAVSKVMDGTGVTQLGIGCIEVNNFGDATVTAARMVALAGLQVPASVFLPKKVPLKQGAASIALITAIVVGGLLILSLLLVPVIMYAKQKRRTPALQ